MIKYLTVLVIIFITFSCSVQKKLDKYCPLCPVSTEVKDSIVYIEKISTKTDTIYQVIHGESITIRLPVDCDSLNRVRIGNYNVEMNGLKAEIKYLNGEIVAQFNCPDDSLKHIITVKEKLIDRQRVSFEDNIRDLKSNQVTAWHKFASSFTIIIIVLILVLIALKIKKWI